MDRVRLTKTAVMEMLLADRELARQNGQASAAIRAAELLGKELGMFVPRHNPLHLGKKCRPPRRLGVSFKPHCRQRQLLHPDPTPPPPRQYYTTITAAGFCRGSLKGGDAHLGS